MKSKSMFVGALILICTIAGGLAYVNRDVLASALAAASDEHSHGAPSTAAPGSGSDPLGCHRHGALTYHCH